MSGIPVVLYEGKETRPLDAERRTELLARLLEEGHCVLRTGLSDSSIEPETAVVIGDFGGAHGAAGARPRTVDLAREDPLERLAALGTGEGPARAWVPWFPVIDYERCTNCMQCLSFCLFDVYGVDDQGRIRVQNESNCKTNCPACSRVCPEVAILFPKYPKGPINGDRVRAEDVASESMKVDISALLGGDIYASLRQRNERARQRFSTERDESKALLERKRCLRELGKNLDIPNEVLMTLPSAGEIEERARRAREKLERRRERSKTVQDAAPRPSSEEWGI